MRFLKQNTAQRVTVGPFLDATDGVTPETALTVTGCHLTLMVDSSDVPTLALDADATASGGNNDMVHVTNDDAGFYDLELTASQTNYVGRAVLAVIGTAHLPVFHEFTILPANVYDSLMGTDKLDVNTAELGGTAQTGRDVGAQLDAAASDLSTVAGYLDTEMAAVLAAVDTEVAAIKAKTDALPASPAAVGSAMTLADDAITAAKIAADARALLGIVASGTAQSAAAGNVVVAAGEGALIKAGVVIGVRGSTQGYYQWRAVNSVSTDTVAVDAWDVTPTGTITYVVYAAAPASATNLPPVNATQVGGTTQTAGDLAALLATIDGIVDTIVARVVGTIAAGTHSPQSGDAYARLGAPSGASVIADLGTATAATQAMISTVAGYVDTEVGAIKAKTDLIPASPAATGDIPSASTIAAAVWAYTVEGTLTALNIMRGILAWFGAPKTPGAGTTNPRFRDQADSKNRIDMTVDTTTGERSAVTLDLD